MRWLMERLLLLCVRQAFIVVLRVQHVTLIVSTLLSSSFPEEASAAGFRPCRRCHPDQAHQPEPQAELIERVCHYIQTHLDAPLHLADLSQQFHMSPYHLQRTFKRIKSVTPRQFVESCRLGDFKARLQEGETVTDALYNAGYQSSSSVYERAPVQLGMTPTAYRKGGKGMRIGYSIVESPLGYVLVAATERGVAAVRFGDSEASHRSRFRTRVSKGGIDT